LCATRFEFATLDTKFLKDALLIANLGLKFLLFTMEYHWGFASHALSMCEILRSARQLLEFSLCAFMVGPAQWAGCPVLEAFRQPPNTEHPPRLARRRATKVLYGAL
jgi:hypothetical protein